MSKTMTDKEFFWVGLRQWIHIVNGTLYFSVKEIIGILLLVFAVQFGIVLFFGLLLIYTFKVIALSGAIYLSLIPISFLHYQKIKKQKNAGVVRDENDDLEDIL